MGQNSYQVYIDSCVDLAQTLVIKSEHCAEAVNERLRQFKNHEVDPYDPLSWKYYKNLAGEYHDTDEVMTVISSDNLEEIVFSKTNLLRHKNTKRDYSFGTRQYHELLDRYPDQEDVILGILYPVDIDVAIEAKDNTILTWPAHLVEANEYTLIEQLQWWTTNYFNSFVNMQYTISDSLYYGTMLSYHRLHLIAAIIAFRKQRCKTVEAHSFHVGQYLASHSDLGKHQKFMTIDQSLKFYRDIRYYQRNPGQNATLENLTEDLMTARYLPLAEYTMKHNTVGIEENIDPVISFRRKDMTVVPSIGTSEYINLTQMLEKEIPEAHENPEYIEENLPAIQERLELSPSSTVMTKVLESATVDFTNAQTYRLEKMLMDHWLFYAQRGLYTAVVNIPHPRTADRILLNALDAYILATWCLYRKMEQDPGEIPLLGAERIFRYPMTTREDCESVTDMDYMSDFTIEAAWGDISEAEPMISIDAFYERVDKLHKFANFQNDLIAYQEHLHARGSAQLYTGRMWGDYYLRVQPKGTTYSEWLFSKNLHLFELTRSEAELLFSTIVSKATGLDLSTTPSLRNVQAAMVSAMKSLLSYSVQVVAKMSDSAVIVTDMVPPRVGDQHVSAEGKHVIRLPDYTVLKEKVSAVNLEEMPVDFFSDLLAHRVWAETKHWINLDIGPREPERGVVYNSTMRLTPFDMDLVNPPDVSGTNLQPILGQDIYMSLTPEQKQSYSDFFFSN